MSLFGNLKSDGLEQTQDRLVFFNEPAATEIYTGCLITLVTGRCRPACTAVFYLA